MEYLKVPFLSNTQYPLGQLALAPSKVLLANIWLDGELSLFLTLNGASEFVAAFEVAGAVVGIEGAGAFTEIFRNVYPKNVMGSAVLLNRGINFYLFVLVSGIVIIINQLRMNREDKVKE